MQSFDNNTKAFLALVRAGLWETDIRLSHFNCIDFSQVLKLAEEQSVVGLVAAGLEHVTDVKLPKELSLQFVGQALQLEQRNLAMNKYIAEIINKLRAADIYTLLVKGQGIAQCYERPHWRASGDVDFYLSEDNFIKAREFFRAQVNGFIPNNENSRRIEMRHGPWAVELHANQRITLSAKVNNVLDEVHRDLFCGGNVRSWDNNGMQIFLPSADNDALIIFTHFLNHFYKGGVGLRQICDWCRLLWTYRDTLDLKLLEKRIHKAGLLDEWRAFGAFAVKYLGMPIEAMPLLDDDLNANLNRKADRICEFILEVGNFGHNRDTSYFVKHPFLIRKAISASWRFKDWLRHARIFPMDSIRFLFGMTISGLIAVSHGE